MEDWGGFATCVTAIFALVSVFLAFKAFSSQTLAAKRASFDATFTQIFAQHSILYKKSNARQWYIVILQDLEDIFNSEYIIMQDQLQINKFGKNTIDAYK